MNARYFFYCSYTDKPAWCKRRSVFWKHTQKTQLSEIKEDRTFDMCVQGLFFLSHGHRGRLYNIAFHYVFRGICNFHFGFKWRNFRPIFYSLNFQFINLAHDLPLEIGAFDLQVIVCLQILSKTYLNIPASVALSLSPANNTKFSISSSCHEIIYVYFYVCFHYNSVTTVQREIFPNQIMNEIEGKSKTKKKSIHSSRRKRRNREYAT